MNKNQNDKSNQQPGSKSHQEQTQDGKKKEETNPNNPRAGSAKGETDTDVQNIREDKTTSKLKGNQISKKGSI